jgi:hypothetical protein
MNTKKDLMQGLIDYLTDVYDRKKIGGMNQDFFIKIKELDKKLEKYFLFFENESELKSDIESYYNRIKHMSFPHEDGNLYYIKHLSANQNGNPISGNVSYPPEWHNNYSHNIHSHLIKVFKDKLGIKKKIGEIMHANLMQFSKDKPEDQEKKEYSLAQIALIYIYKDNETISRKNANKIAEIFGYNSANSGEKLYHNFSKYVSITDRKGDTGTKRRNNIKIKLLNSIIEFLPEDKQQKVKDEIEIIEIINKNEY